MEANEAIQSLLDARSIVYSALARVFAEEPEESIVRLFANSDFAEICSVFNNEQNDASENAAQIASIVNSSGTQSCSREYSYWFIGQKARVYPWESVHVTGEAVIFQQSTLEVRESYRAQGFQSAGYPHEPDDHIATELDFLAKLSEKAQKAYSGGNLATCKRALEASRDFLEKHIGAWTLSFEQSFHAKSEANEKGFSFYASLAALVDSIVVADKAITKEVLEAL